jgi:hypothetical protein
MDSGAAFEHLKSRIYRDYAEIAQLAEQRICTAKVAGSIPAFGSFNETLVGINSTNDAYRTKLN